MALYTFKYNYLTPLHFKGLTHYHHRHCCQELCSVCIFTGYRTIWASHASIPGNSCCHTCRGNPRVTSLWLWRRKASDIVPALFQHWRPWFAGLKNISETQFPVSLYVLRQSLCWISYAHLFIACSSFSLNFVDGVTVIFDLCGMKWKQVVFCDTSILTQCYVACVDSGVLRVGSLRYTAGYHKGQLQSFVFSCS